MSGSGERKTGALRPDFNRRTTLIFQIASFSSDSSLPLFRETDHCFGISEKKADEALARPEMYDYCENERVTYFIRWPRNETLNGIGRNVG